MDNYIQPENIYGKPADKKSHSFFVIKIIILVFLIVGTTYYYSRPPKTFVPESSFFVKDGANPKIVARELKEQGYINSQFIFVSFLQIFGNDRKISPGEYYFKNPKSSIFLAYDIGRGIHNIKPIKVTIPEGSNYREVASIIYEKIPTIDKNAFLESAKSLEGYLFPETYFFYPHTDASSIISQLNSMFYIKIAKFKNDILKSNRSEKDIIIMASIIEREANGNEDREMISGILWNRLEKGIPLQVDASVAYAVQKVSGLTRVDMKIDSPYNTYLYKGLPPTPIANPGELSIKASIKPALSDYLFYLHDNSGGIHYAKTYKEHLANIQKYLR